MNRREMFGVAAAIAAMGAASVAGAGEHSHHHGGGNAEGPRYAALVAAAARCVAAGEICLNHCVRELGSGDTMLAECARRVNEMLALCGALRSVAAQNGEYVAALARIAGEMCRSCEEECRKHEDMHAQCRDCAESCAECRKECAAVG
ncbi:MAG: four-helix bundle copper-binding protein [Betaproteobacteria bacterium]|nr:four-helix bundle copper-binding protein [Betaproteobacteria bacterium]